MAENELLIALGIFGVLLGVFWRQTIVEVKAELVKNREQAAKLPETIKEISQLVSDSDVGMPNFNDLKEDLVDLVQDLFEESMSNMQMPTAQDHIFGAISNIIQHKIMQNAPPGLAEMIPALNEEAHASDIHGGPQTDTKEN